MPEQWRTGEKTYRGIPAAAGVCRGKALVLGLTRHSIPHYSVQETDLPEQLHRLELALVQTRQQILEVQRRVGEAMGAEDASIFEAHLLVLEDRTLIDEVTRLMSEERVNVEDAFHRVSEKYAATLEAIGDDYLRERAADMRDVRTRVLGNLLGAGESDELKHLKEPVILISHDLSPSTTALLDTSKVLGLATDIGSKTSHTAIMARSLKLPAVVGLKNISVELQTGHQVLLDGFNGLVILNPSDQVLFEYGQVVRRHVTFQEKLGDLKEAPAVTLDGACITLSANVEQPEDAESVRNGGAEGVGLFRTEYLFIHRNTLPSEEEQYEAYRSMAQAVSPHPVVIRTLDLGGDKFLSPLTVAPEINPFLGWRAIRFCLQEREIFRNQLRAILRASAHGNVKLMYPMISGIEELVQANELVEVYKSELRTEGLRFDESVEIGAMIEIPSAVLVADTLAKRAKFFSIGTNDLIQYTLAVDRMNEKIAHLYEPTHPAIIRLIRATVEAAHQHGIWAGVCGEMAADPALVPLLLGLGADELSVAPPLVPQIKFMIRRLKMQDARELANFALQCESGEEVLRRSEALAKGAAPELFPENR